MTHLIRNLSRVRGFIPGLVALLLITYLTGCGQIDAPAPNAAAQPVSASQTAEYPLDVCVVSGEKLGAMGEPIVMTYDGVEVKLCCKSCVEKFEKEPAKYVAMVRAGAVSHDHEGEDHADHQH